MNLLSKTNFIEQLNLREKELCYQIKVRKKRLKSLPEGMLYICDRGHYHQYYKRTSTNNRGSYIKKSEKELIADLAKKKYDISMIRAAEKELKIIRWFLDNYSDEVSEINSQFPEELTKIITPAHLTDEEYAELWQSVPYKTYNKYEVGEDHITIRGEYVRSKSEELIANTLLRLGIPYRYEYPVKIYNGEFRHPDFTILNVKTRKVIYLEHLGKIGDPRYTMDNMIKFDEYAKSGIIIGKNLCVTYENLDHPLNSRMVEIVLKELLDLE